MRPCKTNTDTKTFEKTSSMTTHDPISSSKLAKQDEASTVKVELEAEPGKSELVFLWVFFAVLVILTVVAGYILWKKVALTS
jgi:hypothetical protein